MAHVRSAGLQSRVVVSSLLNLGKSPRFSTRQSRFVSSELQSTENSSVAEPLGTILRHGQGDGVVVLNVGGKEFKTLRSTVASNSVLAEHVARAEANKELTSGGNAIFIDREPTHFGFILQYLRNRCDNVSYQKSLKKKLGAKLGSTKVNKVNAQDYVKMLPTDGSTLKEIYAEAGHYQIYELQKVLCKQKFVVQLMDSVGGGNPFVMANDFLRTLRRGLVAVGGLGTMIGVQVGIRDDKESEELFTVQGLMDTTQKVMAEHSGK